MQGTNVGVALPSDPSWEEYPKITQKEIIERILFYWSKLYVSKIKDGDSYKKLKKTIVILIANFEIEKLKEIKKFHTEWKLREKDYSKIILTEKIELHIIELPKITKEINTEYDKKLIGWLKFIRNPNEMEEKEMSNKAIKEAKKELEKIQADEYEQRIAELRMKHLMDTASIKEDGFEEGLEQGIKKEKNEIAKRMLDKNMSLEEISEITGLTEEEIKKL